MEQHYCMSRTRSRFPYVFLGLLYLFFAFCVGVYLCTGPMVEDQSDWSVKEYGVLVIGWGAAIGLTVGGIYTCYGAVRDSLFPNKSQIAKSIRSQLPYPEEAPDARELFAMVDRDIAENGQWFDRVAVGKEWVLGDQVSYIPRIRLVFGQDELKCRNVNGRSQTTRIVCLYILDDRRQVQITGLRNPNELPMLLDCIRLRAPAALVRPYSEYADWCGKSDEEWDQMLYEYRQRETERDTQAYMADPEQGMVLARPDGSVTSRIAPEELRERIRSQKEFSLTPGVPIPAGNITLSRLTCAPGGEQVLLSISTPVAQGVEGVFQRWASREEADRILSGWLRREPPDLSQWTTGKLQDNRQAPVRERPEGSLSLKTPAGVYQSHREFTLEDVDVAAEGLISGAYQSAELTLPGGYLWFRAAAGDASDGRFHVFATRADADQLRFFQTRCTHRQAAEWLRLYARGQFRPNAPEWTDYTRQAHRKG